MPALLMQLCVLERAEALTLQLEPKADGKLVLRQTFTKDGTEKVMPCPPNDLFFPFVNLVLDHTKSLPVTSDNSFQGELRTTNPELIWQVQWDVSRFILILSPKWQTERSSKQSESVALA